MAGKSELQVYMKVAADEIDGAGTPCPSEEALIAYAQRLGDDRTREEIQSHLAVCGKCRATVLDAAQFFEAAPQSRLKAHDVDREWARFAEANAIRERTTPIRTIRRGWGSWFSTPAVAWAAGLGVVLMTGAVWALLSQQRFHAEIAASNDRIARLENENRTLRAAQAGELARLRTPRLDAPIVDLYPRGALERSGGGKPRSPARIAPGSPALFVLNGAGQANYPAYALDVYAGGSRLVWHGEGLRRGADGNYTASFPAGFLSDGEYRIEISGVRNGRSVKLAEYEVAIGDKLP